MRRSGKYRKRNQGKAVNEDEKKEKVVFVDLEEYKQKGIVKKEEYSAREQTAREKEDTDKKAGKEEEGKTPEEITVEDGTGMKNPSEKASPVREERPEPESTPLRKPSSEEPEEASAEKERERAKMKLFYKITGAAAAVCVIAGGLLITRSIMEKNYQKEKDAAFTEAKEEMDADMDVLAHLENLNEKYPEDSRGYEYLAEVYFESGEYEKVMEILDQGRENAEDTDDSAYSDLYDRAERRKQYYDIMEQADKEAESGLTEEARTKYLEAIEVEGGLGDAYYALTDLYIGQGQYDVALDWLDSVNAEGEFTHADKDGLIEQCLRGKQNTVMKKLETLIKNKDYTALQKWFSEEDYTQALGAESYEVLYYQNGGVTDGIASGTGMMLSAGEIYLGGISNNQKSGKGVRFECWGGSYYYVTDSSWSNDKANGKFTYSQINIKDKTENCIYSGTVKDNLFHGDITCKEYCSDGVMRTFYMHAENGTFDCIRVQDEGYVFGETNDNWYVYYKSEDGLKGHGV